MQSGDYPLKVAQQFGVTVDELVAFNEWGSVNEFPFPGTVIKIPPGATVAAATPETTVAAAPATEGEAATDRVDRPAVDDPRCRRQLRRRRAHRRGGRLPRSSVAKKFDVTVDALNAANAEHPRLQPVLSRARSSSSPARPTADLQSDQLGGSPEPDGVVRRRRVEDRVDLLDDLHGGAARRPSSGGRGTGSCRRAPRRGGAGSRSSVGRIRAGQIGASAPFEEQRVAGDQAVRRRGSTGCPACGPACAAARSRCRRRSRRHPSRARRNGRRSTPVVFATHSISSRWRWIGQSTRCEECGDALDGVVPSSNHRRGRGDSA